MVEDQKAKRLKEFTKGKLQERGIISSTPTQQTQSNIGLTAEQQNLKDWTKNKLQEQGILPGINQGTQTATTTTTLPGITKLQNLQESNKIQFGSNAKSNIILPGISEPKYPNATLSQATQETEKEGNKRANDNVKDTRSMNEVIHDEMISGEYIPLLKQGVIQTWNDVKKIAYRKGVEAVENFANHPYETFLGSSPVLKVLGNELDKKRLEDPNVKAQVDKGISTMWKSYYRYEDKINNNFEKRVDKNMNKIITKEYQDSGGVWESIKSGNTDMVKYGLMQGFSTSALPMIPGIIAGIVTKNPTITASIAFASTAPIEDQEAYEEAMKEGATRDEATQIGRYAGIINGTLETVGEFLQLKGLLKPLKKNISKEITKKTTRQIIGRGLWEWSKGVGGESLTEGTQELVTNALIKTINENKDIFEGVLDSMIVGGVLGGGGSTLGAGGAMIEEHENNKKIDLATDIEALNYVMQGEQRKAQRMQQKEAEQREKIKQKILSRRKAKTWGEVEEIDNKFQKTDEENAGFSSRNEYSEGRNIGWEKDENLSTNSMYVSDTTISESSSHSDRMTTDSFFETDEKGEYIEYDDGSRKERIYAGGNKTNKNGSIKSQFTEKSKGTPRTPKLKKYYDNFNRLVKNLSNPNVKVNDYVQIGKTGKGKNIYISKGVLAHIIEDHGVFGVNTLIESVNNPTGQKWESETTKTRQGGHGTRPYMEYDIGSEDSEIVVGIKPDSWEKDTDTAEYYGVVSMRESNAPTTPADNVKFQLKYEEKGYTPGVANKKEKNISGKEGIKQKNTINDETIEQLAEKYGVKVEVIKGMIEILKKGKREGYAYGKYRDQLLTLSEQIKESTAPHELLHAIFDMIDPETKTYLIAQVMKSEGWNAETAEERLADSFSNFFRTGKIEGAPKSTWGRIKIFFKRVRSFINGMNKWRNELNEIFTDIITADGIVDLQSKIDESSRLNKSKEKMRKRFMEYRKNAQKIQSNKAPKDWSKKDASYQIADESVYELQPLERIEQMEKNILDEYGETDNPGRVAFIDNKGRWINGNMGGYGNYRDVDHREIAQTAFDDTDIEFNNGTDGLVALQAQTGLVRVNYNDGYMNIDTVYELMPSQREGLMKFADENIEEVNVDITDQKTGRTVKSDTFMNVRDAVRWIDRHFAESENKYQKAGDINSPAFKKRFGNSKVVDKDGNPLVVYHGTADKFTVFDRKFDGKNTGNNGLYGNGFYFTNDIETAKFYGGKRVDLPLSDYDNDFVKRDKARGEKSNIMGVYLKMEKPFYWKSIKNANQVRKLMNLIHVRGLKWNDYLKEMRTIVDDEQAINFRKGLDNAGYDGIIYEGDNGNEYAVFYPNQIKSATDNVGTYDANNDDIRYQKMDDEYAEAVENGNTTRAKAILREYAKEKGYNSSTDYQGSLAFNGSAPSSDGLTKEERVSGNEDIYSQTLGDFASDGLDWWDLGRQLDPNGGLGIARSRASRGVAGGVYDLESINNLRNAVMEYKKGNKDVKIRMYRAIDSDIKEEKFRNGDWITPSKEYAKHHIDLQDWKKGRVISEDVSIEDIRWDGNDINERGFDNEKEYGYKDTPNNRKELEITYDDNGNLIPLSERFNENVEDERYQRAEEKWYRGQEEMGDEGRGIKHNKTAVTENAEGGVFVTPYKKDAVKYGDYVLEFKKLKENTVTIDEANKLQERASKKVENDLKNQIETDYYIEQMAFGRLRGFAEYTKKPFVETGNPLGEKGEAVFFEDIAKKYNVKYQRVYHGTKADFDKFDSSHMGEGEGGQAHGWGHYVAVDKGTGKRYAENYGYISFRGKKRGELPNNMKGTALYAIMGDIMDGKDKAEAIKDESEYMLTNYLNTLDETYKNTYDYLQTVKPEDFEGNRHLYEVEIPDPVKADTPTGKNYLEEDDYLEMEEVQKFIKELKDWNYKAGKELEDSLIYEDNGEWYFNTQENGKGLYRRLENLLGSDKDASEFLNFIGYDGIHYFGNIDGESYVIFNDDALEIKNHEKYQKAGDTNSEAFKKRFGNSIDVDENGNPKELYHGTTEGGWDTFDRSRVGRNAQELGPGFYFTNDYNTAKEYTYNMDKITGKTKRGNNPEIKKVYVSIQNPLVWNKEMIDLGAIKKVFMDGNNEYFFESTIPFKTNGKEIDGKVRTKEEVEKLSKSEKVDLMIKALMYGHNKQDYEGINKNLLNEIPRAYELDNRGDVLDKLKKYTGKDGVYYKNWRGLEQYVTWNEGQAKYSDNNVGTYDMDNPDMKFQKAGNTKSANFKKRFDGSKVVKENGKPQIVYHGTTAEFTVFNKIASRGIFGDGYYFTNRIGTARQYGYGRDGRVMKVYLAIKNPYVADNGDGYFLNTEKLKEEGYDGVQAIMGSETYWVAFDSNQIKSATDNVGTYDPNNDDIRYQKAEYEYDEDGNIKWLKFGEENEFDPSIFGTPTKEEQIEEDKENEKSNPFYNAWMKYNNQNYKDDQLTLGEFVDAVGAWGDKKQEEFNKKQNDILEAENDPKMLELQLRAVKLMEEEGNVGKKFGKNVSKEVRDRQQAEVEKKREDLAKDIYEWMYPGLSFEESTYEDQSSAWDKEAEWEMLGKDKIEEKLKYFKKDKNGNWEKKDIKIETPQEQREKIEKSGNFDEVIEPKDRVIQWETPEGQKGRLDKAKDPRQFKKVMEKINSGKSKTKVELKDVTNEVRALERYKENERAEKERRKKEKQEEYAKKKQEEYKRNVRLKAFQRLVDMQRFEKYPFLSEDEIKQRWGFTDEEWKKITEQLDLGYPPKKRNEKAVSDFNKAVDSEVKFIIEGLSRQNKMKQKEAEKNLGEIGEIDLDVLLGKDEEKGQKEVEEFERIAEEEKKKSKKEKNKRLEQAREDVTQVEIDKERENSKSEKERVDKIIKSTKSDNTVWGSIKKTASDILTPVSTRIREISPKIYRELMRYFQNKDILTNQRLKEIDPFLKAMGKIRKENPVRFMDIWVALANRNIGYANGLLQEYGVKVPTKLLDTIFDEAEDVGLNINYLGSYYPLSVKAPKSFLEELMKVGNGDIASEIEKKIQQESQKKGGPLDESEITAIINSVIAGEEKGPDVNLGNKHLKKRNTEIERTEKMLEYCDDPISTLIGYVEGMTDKIERAKFLGKSRSGNVHTLADYVYNAKNGLTAEQQDELMELLKSVFNDASPNKFYQTWRDIATLTTLGSPSSTLTQIGDLSFSIYENGWREALKAVWDIFMKRKAFDLKDMGVINRGEEYTNINSQKNLLQKAIHNVFKLTFFSNFDTFGKSTFIQSTWNKRRKRALKGENGDPQLIKDIMKITDDEYLTYKIINDLRNGIFSEEVALVMYMKLGNIQPLTKAQMPKAYLDNPNGRLFYQFKTFGIKQLDYVLQETKQQTKGFKNLSTTDKFWRVAQIASMIFIMTLMGAGASELKDITMRRRSNSLILRWLFGEEVGSDQIWDKIGDSALQLFGLSRYTVMQMKSDPVDAITNLFTTFPATNLIAYPFKDINKAFKDDGSINWRNPSSYQLIPVIGKYRYWIYGGGQDKQQEALDKEKKTTTSGGSSRSTRTTRSTRNSRSRRNTR